MAVAVIPASLSDLTCDSHRALPHRGQVRLEQEGAGGEARNTKLRDRLGRLAVQSGEVCRDRAARARDDCRVSALDIAGVLDDQEERARPGSRNDPRRDIEVRIQSLGRGDSDNGRRSVAYCRIAARSGDRGEIECAGKREVDRARVDGYHLRGPRPKVTRLTSMLAASALGPARVRSNVSFALPVLVTVNWKTPPGAFSGGLSATATPFATTVSLLAAVSEAAPAAAVTVKSIAPSAVPACGVRFSVTSRKLLAPGGTAMSVSPRTPATPAGNVVVSVNVSTLLPVLTTRTT